MQKPEIRRKLDEVDNWKLYVVTKSTGEKYYLLKGYLGHKEFEDYPQLCVSALDAWVSYKFPQSVPDNVRQLVFQVLFRRFKRGIMLETVYRA